MGASRGFVTPNLNFHKSFPNVAPNARFGDKLDNRSSSENSNH